MGTQFRISTPTLPAVSQFHGEVLSLLSLMTYLVTPQVLIYFGNAKLSQFGVSIWIEGLSMLSHNAAHR